jgi:hypothetical protein
VQTTNLVFIEVLVYNFMYLFQSLNVFREDLRSSYWTDNDNGRNRSIDGLGNQIVTIKGTVSWEVAISEPASGKIPVSLHNSQLSEVRRRE